MDSPTRAHDVKPSLPDDVALDVSGLGKTFRPGRMPFAPRDDRDEGPVNDDDVDEEVIDQPDDAPAPERREREIVALEDVTFTLARGAMAGIVGDSGAGKTVLLRLIGRTTAPSTGSILVREPVIPPVHVLSRLVEPDQTGAQNVRLLARMLGVGPEAAERATADALALADVGRHVEMRISRWPTGFIARFTFALALSLRPGLLLSEGPPIVSAEEFREQSRQAVREATAAGTTVLMSCRDGKSLLANCDVGLWLDGGRLRAFGPAGEVAAAYSGRRLPDVPEVPDAGREKQARFDARQAEKHERAELRLAQKNARAEQQVADRSARAARARVVTIADVAAPASTLELALRIEQPLADLVIGAATRRGGRRRRIGELFEQGPVEPGVYTARLALGGLLPAGVHDGLVRVSFQTDEGGSTHVLRQSVAMHLPDPPDDRPACSTGSDGTWDVQLSAPPVDPGAEEEM